jgi:hypothetical protein
MFNLIEGDGVIENLYHLLWTKDTIFNTDPNVVIPHTIIYKYQKPCYWYFSSKIDNKFKKKSAMKITKDHIKEVFLSRLSKSGIVAYYIYKKYGNMSKYHSDTINFHDNRNNCGSKEGTYIVEYMDEEKFIDFLENKLTYEDGILQKFEDPKAEYNSTIRLIWSPKICILEKSSNLKKIYDTRFSIYERAVTYDGEEFHTQNEPIKGSNLPDRIEKIGNNIAAHISNISLERIKIVRMMLNFKITKDDKIIFLWCSSLRIDNIFEKKKEIENDSYKQFDINKIKLNVPDNVNLFKFSTAGKSIKPLKDSNCLNCDQKIESYRLYEINYRTLIESHDNRKRDKNYFKMFQKMNISIF